MAWNKYNKKYYYKHRKERLEKAKFYYQTQRGKYKKYQYCTKIRKINFQLTFEDFCTFWQKDCFYCGAKIKTIGLDRVINKNGYTIKNCISCCIRCNKMKLIYSKKNFIQHCNKIINLERARHRIHSVVVHQSHYALFSPVDFLLYVQRIY